MGVTQNSYIPRAWGKNQLLPFALLCMRITMKMTGKERERFIQMVALGLQS